LQAPSEASAWQDGARFYPAAFALCALVLALTAPVAPGAGVISAAVIGGLFVMHRTALSLTIVAALMAGVFLVPDASKSSAYWSDLAIVIIAAVFPRRLAPALLQAPRWSWLLGMTLGTAGLCLHFLLPGIAGQAAIVVASLCAAFIGAGIARHVAVVDARLLAWGDRGMVEVTRDLLLGRITSGMLHDLAQPLNVISMANANMDYIIAHLQIDDESRRQLQERVKRIATHTEGAAGILSLFRWFGRDGRDGGGELTVRSALECAVAATKSNVRHHGVAIQLRGNALDHQVPQQHGALEMMAVAALLSAFSSFICADGRKLRGDVLLNAVTTPAHVVVTVECTDAEHQPLPSRRIDEATLWLIEQVAQEVASDFRCVVRDRQPVRFIIRLGRNDI
jgi:signal transduction histidine kinase